jgi:acetyl esterase/lipase
LLFLRFKPPYNFMILWLPQLVHHALSPFLIVIGGLGAVLGWVYDAPVAIAAGLLGAGISAFYIWQVTRPQPGFALAFGADWHRKLPPQQNSHLLQRRWGLGLPQAKAPHWTRDIPFWTIPGTDRKLLCDVWQPPDGVTPTGLAFIYLHGSGWYLSHKDVGTRPFFRQLTAQGHVVMDVGYRLCPEVDIYEMVGDVKRAVAWMKSNADAYHVNPERIVLGGASAGAHLAMLAAYAPDHPRLTPPDVQGCDLSVRAVISYYGPTDLRAVYQHTHQERIIGLPKVEIGLPGAAQKELNMQDAGRLDTLLGGHLHEIPEIYQLASPVAHVHPDCPPTLLIQTNLDFITPTAATHELYDRLVACGVPAILIAYPLTQHAFDLVLPQVSPPAHAALYDVERFLALVA